MLIQIDAVAKNPREFGGKQIWGVKLPDGTWLNLESGFRPEKGMRLDVNIKDVRGKDGKVYHNATIIAPGASTGYAANLQKLPQPIPPGFANPEPQWPDPAKVIEQSKPSYTGPAKISWGDWELMTRSAWELCRALEMPSEESVAVVNTTLIAYSNGKLELPTDAGPALVEEPPTDAKSDDVPW